MPMQTIPNAATISEESSKSYRALHLPGNGLPHTYRLPQLAFAAAICPGFKERSPRGGNLPKKKRVRKETQDEGVARCTRSA
jgi:hypothetical protein